MQQATPLTAEFILSKKQTLLGLVAVFAIYISMVFLIQTVVIARPRMAADLNGMAWYSWSISIPSLAAAFVTLLFSKFSDMYGRRRMLMIAMIIYLAGTIGCAVSPTFPILIAASTLSRVGSGGLLPLVYAVLGDMFAPTERSKWVGLLNIPQGIFALFGPTLGGWFVDNLSWRHLYWMGVPLIIFCILIIPSGIPSIIKKAVDKKIDVRGAVLVAIASSATILGLSFAGTTYAWGSEQVIGLLGIALLFWILFFLAEGKVDEPIMDPKVFRNRTFLTIAIAGLMSFFGLMGMMMYYPVFLQGVLGASAKASGLIITPFNVLIAFIGVPTGFILARTKRYKWMYVASYGLLTAVMAGSMFLNAETPIFVAVLVATLAGLGLGAIPTLNTLVVQYAVPKKLLGASMGAIFFSITMGMAIAPAVLGSVMNAGYAKSLKSTLPSELSQFADKATLAALGDPKAVLSPKARKELEATFSKEGAKGANLFIQTVAAIRTSLQKGVRNVFLLGALTMLISFLLITTVPEVPIDAATEDKKVVNHSAVAGKSPDGGQPQIVDEQQKQPKNYPRR
jgi:MFS family permease